MYGICVLFTMLIPLAPVKYGDMLISYASPWIRSGQTGYLGIMSLLILLAVCASALILGANAVISLLSKKQKSSPFAISAFTSLMIMILGAIFKVFSFFGILLCVISILCSTAAMVFTQISASVNRENNKAGKKDSVTRTVLTVIAALSTAACASILMIPFLKVTSAYTSVTIIPLGVLSGADNLLLRLGVFLGASVAVFVSISGFFNSFKSFGAKISVYSDRLRQSTVKNVFITGAYVVSGVVCAVLNAKKASLFFEVSSYVPFLITTVLAIAFSICARNTTYEFMEEHRKIAKGARIEFFIYSALLSTMALICSLTSFIKVEFTFLVKQTITINGWKLITRYASAEAGFQMVAFFVVIIVTINLSLLLLNLFSFISRSKTFYKLGLASVIAASLSCLLIGIFGKYYEIVQKLNIDKVKTLLFEAFGTVPDVNATVKVKSAALLWFVAAMVVLLIVLIRKPYSRGIASEAIIDSAITVKTNAPSTGNSGLPQPGGNDAGNIMHQKNLADPCPAFTQIDLGMDAAHEVIESLEKTAFEQPTLPKIVKFVTDYARRSRLHLFYNVEDIAAFVAGLGAARLTILQGMSGTGKTSLPKIFCEALFGSCDIIEVESAWRDKNELMGYYNEFSRANTPKKFTEALYKASLSPERLTLIVLDEMNLSRIEYYFSDFLSLMENEEDNRYVRLLSTPIVRNENGNAVPYAGLLNGHTVKVTPNVWFVGTANRDESTFEISDKVYDRAHTMNFNKRASRYVVTEEPLNQKFMNAQVLYALLEEAKQRMPFAIESYPIISKAETLLAPYNISFGNRIANQIEAFVSIYCACFDDSTARVHEAVETILLSKVVAKLEFRSVENKQALASEFAAIGLNRCSDFIKSLSED